MKTAAELRQVLAQGARTEPKEETPPSWLEETVAECLAQIDAQLDPFLVNHTPHTSFRGTIHPPKQHPALRDHVAHQLRELGFHFVLDPAPKGALKYQLFWDSPREQPKPKRPKSARKKITLSSPLVANPEEGGV